MTTCPSGMRCKQHTQFLKTPGANRAEQRVLSSESPHRNKTWDNVCVTQKSKAGYIPPQAADTHGEVPCSAIIPAQLAHPSTVFGHLKLSHTLSVKTMPWMEEPGKVVCTILATALEIRFMRSKSLFSSKSFPVLFFPLHYMKALHAFTVRCHIRMNIALAAVPKWQLTPCKTAPSVPFRPNKSSSPKPLLASAADIQKGEHHLVLF